MLRGMNYNGVIMMGKLALRLCLISYYHYAPNFEKVGSILLSAYACMPASVKKNQARVLKFHIWIPHQNSLPVFFFLSELSPLAELCPF